MSGVRCIVNADDFGLSAAVNEAVLEACERGILTSATIMANMPGFAEAVRGAKTVPKLGIGVHLNFLRGRPLSDPARIPTLVGRDGRFLDGAVFWRRSLFRRVDEGEAEEECVAQIRRVIDAGILPTHVDSEKHLHVLVPDIGAAVCRAAARFGIRAVRMIREPLRPLPRAPWPGVAGILKTAILNGRATRLVRMSQASGLRFADRFFGAALAGRMSAEVYRALFRRLPPGSVEIMCHPARSEDASAGVRSPSWLDRHRPGEYRALVDPSVVEAAASNDIELVTYGALR